MTLFLVSYGAVFDIVLCELDFDSTAKKLVYACYINYYFNTNH